MISPPEPRAVWRWDGVIASAVGGALQLVHGAEGAELLVRGDRLARGAGYATASPRARRTLARLGALVRLRQRGRYLVHASGAVDPRGRAWLLAGGSGSGKSTLAYALARAGWSILGDDGVLIEVTADAHAAETVITHAWRDPLRVSAALAAEFPELAAASHAAVFAPGDVRHRIDVPPAPQRVFPHRAPAVAVVFVARATRDAVAPLSPRTALARLVGLSPWVLLDDAEAGPHLNALRCLATSVTALQLDHTPVQLRAIARTLEEALP